MFKRFLRHNFNIPLAVLLVITAVVFITAGIITGKNSGLSGLTKDGSDHRYQNGKAHGKVRDLQERFF